MVSGGLTRRIEIPSARMDHIQSIRVGSAIIVTKINLKPARNAGCAPPAGFSDKLLNLGKGPVVPIVVEKEHLIEPHTGNDKGPAAGGGIQGMLAGRCCSVIGRVAL